MKKIEIVDTKEGGKITIASDRVTVKIAPNDPNREFIANLAEKCKDVNFHQTLRGKLNQFAIDAGYILLSSGNSNGNKKVLGVLYINETPVRFEER